MTAEQLGKMSSRKMEDVDINTLVEVNSVRYDESLSTEKKVEKMIARTGNPYFRRSGNSKIKISFSNNGENLKDNYIAMLVNA